MARDVTIQARTDRAAHNAQMNGQGAGSDRQSDNGQRGALEEVPPCDPAVIALITGEQATRLRCVPIRTERGRLEVAMVDLADFAAADEVSVTAGMPVTRIAVTEAVMRDLLDGSYGTTAAAMAARLAGDDGDEESLANLEAIDAEALHRMAEQPTLINLVNLLIVEAIRRRTSDIHIEPFDRDLAVKYRIDGELERQQSPPKHLQPAITSRVKIMAGMNIAERYVPQDGHITLRFEGRKVDIRVSTVPTIYGESVVMRILDKETVNLDLETLGMREADRSTVERLIRLPHGMVLVTGPTGSGKTTTLYAALTKVFDPTKKIITIEDPVEYELDGVNQIPVNPKRGLSFASGLRSILRQDPDIIMVGEIRDAETADIAVRSALTGHLLFSTLHTNDAVSAIGRLMDMGVEPFLLASVLEGVIAQRLGRRIRPDARIEKPIDDAIRLRLQPEELKLFADGTGGHRCFDAAPSDKPGDTGFEGRLGFFELLEINTDMRGAIGQRVNARELASLASPGHVTMRGDGLLKASQGSTTIEQVLRATQDSERVGE